MSCGKFVFLSHNLPLPILDVPSWEMVNSSSHLITCHFPSWTSHLLWYFRLPISLPATSHLGRPISCGKFVFPSHYLPLPILDVPSRVVNSPSHLITCHFPSDLDVPSPVVNSSSHLITCHFPSWTSVFSWKSQDSCQI